MHEDTSLLRLPQPTGGKHPLEGLLCALCAGFHVVPVTYAAWGWQEWYWTSSEKCKRHNILVYYTCSLLQPHEIEQSSKVVNRHKGRQLSRIQADECDYYVHIPYNYRVAKLGWKSTLDFLVIQSQLRTKVNNRIRVTTSFQLARLSYKMNSIYYSCTSTACRYKL